MDNFSRQEERLANHYFPDDRMNLAKFFIGKLKPAQLAYLDQFLDFLDHTPNWSMDVKGMNLIWAKWSLNLLSGVTDPPRALEPQSSNLSV